MECMEKPWDSQISKMSEAQLRILKYWLGNADRILTNREIAIKTGIVEKQLGGVLSALSRKRVGGVALLLPMGRVGRIGVRWMLNSKAITIALATNQVQLLLKSFRKLN